MAASVPAFQLYGENDMPPIPRFIHWERIAARAPVHDWEIRVHRHPDLCQAFLLTDGGASLEVEGRRTEIGAPWLLWLPTGIVHGFRFAPGSAGHVLTISDHFLSTILSGENHSEVGSAMRRVTSVAAITTTGMGIAAEASFTAIGEAVTATASGWQTVLEAHMKLLLVLFARLGTAATEPPSGDTELFRRFRRLVEDHYRARWTIGAYGEALGAGTDRLHAVVRRVAGCAPREIVQRRLLLEAKRNLIYTTMTVSEIAYDLGFRDAAYFSRFFSLRVGAPPSVFRQNRGVTGSDLAAAGAGLRLKEER
ncbi:transcriptional regulator, AraC family [Faunimonas pinastri]|uniref:Transcriptional regulator, AraC family n=1 Tax=Faunimonas pinastri TaxID=1855383 RepID=A0A1H9K7E7_9HYPH|nr:helix-turn-helix domain-containing protein [Faunimonas pinastri]SEQ95051.1 transcriptional regulator, AraC family [Faunimonas pinastri]